MTKKQRKRIELIPVIVGAIFGMVFGILIMYLFDSYIYGFILFSIFGILGVYIGVDNTRYSK